MSNRLATRIGLPVLEERASDAIDLVLFEEPSVGALARTKGSLFLLAQISGSDAGLARATAEAGPSFATCPSLPRITSAMTLTAARFGIPSRDRP